MTCRDPLRIFALAKGQEAATVTVLCRQGVMAMTGQMLRRDRCGTFFLLATAAILIGLALIAARQARQAMRSADAAMLLFPGFTADELPGHGLVVTSLQSASEAQMHGICVGDEVLAIDNHRVRSLAEAERIVHHNRQAMLALRLIHNATPRDVTLHKAGVRQHGT